VQRRLCSLVEQLEPRLPLAAELELNTVGGQATYAGVGFTNIVVADFRATIDEKNDVDPSHYSAQIDWGDGTGFKPGNVVYIGSAEASYPFEIKGSHVYQAANKLFAVKVKVTGQGQTVEYITTSEYDKPMPEGGIGTPPPAEEHGAEHVTTYVNTVSGFSCYAGVGFELNPVAVAQSAINENLDRDLSHYKAYINWGDSDAWNTAVLAPQANSDDPVIVKGTHVYEKAGSYRVLVYAQGIDGTSYCDDTVTIAVENMPNGAPGTKPIFQDRSGEPANVHLLMSNVSGQSAQKNVPIDNKAVAIFSGDIGEKPITSAGSFHAQINWGDSNDWTDGVIEDIPQSDDFRVLGTHTYTETGYHKVVVYLNGPDGTSKSDKTTSFYVDPPPVPMLTGSVSQTTVAGQPDSEPVASFKSGDTSTPPTQLKCKIDLDTTDPDPPVSAPIRFRGGSTYDIMPPTPFYDEPGVHDAELIVSDGKGHETVRHITYTVVSRPDLTLFVKTYQIAPLLGPATSVAEIYCREKIQIPVTVSNVGTAAAVGAANITLFLTTTPNLSGTKLYLTSKNVTLKLAAGAHQDYVLTATVPETLTIGAHYYVIGKVTSSVIQDPNLANNISPPGRAFTFVQHDGTKVTLSGGVLSIVGDEEDNRVQVTSSGTTIIVDIITECGPHIPLHITKRFSAAQVKSLFFQGGEGDDAFQNQVPAMPSIAYGGPDDDTLEGSNVHDELHGGAGVDLLKGGIGNDDLYGDADADELHGGPGLDGLYGGTGTDKLYGEGQCDRFLGLPNTKEPQDADASDAVIYFQSGAMVWKEPEILQVDRGLRELHLRTKNNKLLLMPDGRRMTLIRNHVSTTEPDADSDNDHQAHIDFYDLAFSKMPDDVGLAAIHEFGHNWDPHSNSNRTTARNWLRLSAWTDLNPGSSEWILTKDRNWWYSKDAKFANNYGKESPDEDWCTAWESYFQFQKHFPNNPPALHASTQLNELPRDKIQFLDAFFTSLR
jgi:Ca2+-binding RTX toxin-like protein